MENEVKVIREYLQDWLRKQHEKYEKLVDEAIGDDRKKFEHFKFKLSEKLNNALLLMAERTERMVKMFYASCSSVRKELIFMAVQCNLKMQEYLLRIEKLSHLKGNFILSYERPSSEKVNELKSHIASLIASKDIPQITHEILDARSAQNRFAALLSNLLNQMKVAFAKLSKCDQPNISKYLQEWRCPHKIAKRYDRIKNRFYEYLYNFDTKLVNLIAEDESADAADDEDGDAKTGQIKSDTDSDSDDDESDDDISPIKLPPTIAKQGAVHIQDIVHHLVFRLHNYIDRKLKRARKRVKSFFADVRMCHFIFRHTADELNVESAMENNGEEQLVLSP